MFPAAIDLQLPQAVEINEHCLLLDFSLKHSPINTFTMQTKHLLNQYFDWEIPSYWTSDGGYHNDDAQDASLYAIAPTGIASPFLILTRCNIWMVPHFSYERYQYRCWAFESWVSTKAPASRMCLRHCFPPLYWWLWYVCPYSILPRIPSILNDARALINFNSMDSMLRQPKPSLLSKGSNFAVVEVVNCNDDVWCICRV